MKVITFNANGLRAAERKGFFKWALDQEADIICIQELKAQADNLEDKAYCLPDYHRFLNCAQAKGYSGVAIYTRCQPSKVSDTFAWDLSRHEGRYLQADFDSFSIVSVYFPSGSSGEVRQKVKFEFMEKFEQHLQAFSKTKRSFILCGDINIVHKEIDIKNFKSNQKNSGCLPEERAWLNKLFTQFHYVDAFRTVNLYPEQYTWWSSRGSARKNNVGWRIDYQIVSPDLKDKIESAEIYTKENFSDHAPLTVNYTL